MSLPRGRTRTAMPFLKNTWYVAANANELEAEMVSRKICGEQIVMFRQSDGKIGAMLDRCPHRFVPLSMGKRVGDTIACGYHGLRFDGTGTCVEAPHDDDSQKARACIKGYAAVERDKLIWICMGDCRGLARPLPESRPHPRFRLPEQRRALHLLPGLHLPQGQLSADLGQSARSQPYPLSAPRHSRGFELQRLHQQGAA